MRAAELLLKLSPESRSDAGEHAVGMIRRKRADHITGHLLTRLGVYTASPVAFLVLIVYAAL